MVGLVFLVPSLVLRRETWLETISWCPVFSCVQSHAWNSSSGETWLDASSWSQTSQARLKCMSH
ncbi:hypothetical protein GIB67_039548, partial [Kingdonia uniflora]